MNPAIRMAVTFLDYLVIAFGTVNPWGLLKKRLMMRKMLESNGKVKVECAKFSLDSSPRLAIIIKNYLK